MHTEDFVVDDGGECQIIKNIRTISPYIYTSELSETFIVEAVDLSDLP